MRIKPVRGLCLKYLALVALMAGTHQAAALGETLPDVGVDIGAWIPVALAGLGAIVGVAVGGKFAFRLVKKGIEWIGRAFAG
jgi:Na+/glutamate symporter